MQNEKKESRQTQIGDDVFERFDVLNGSLDGEGKEETATEQETSQGVSSETVEPIGNEKKEERVSVFSGRYWKDAFKSFLNVKMLVLGALICALRIVVKAFKIPLAGNVLYLTFDCYINSVGSLIYGPVVALAVGAVSDTVGAVLFPTGEYFFPFIFVEMGSAFIFALFLWKRKITAPRVILAKFTVNFVCNVILNSVFMKWFYALYYTDKVYNLFNGVRIVKSMVLFPFEGLLICVILNAVMPVLAQFGFANEKQRGLKIRKRDIILVCSLAVLSVELILLYIFVLKDFISAHNIKFF